jgi:hypothetical protein
MNRHINNEMLSAYLDYEVPLPMRRNLEAHLSGCEECRARLDSLQTVVGGLGRVARAVPPPALASRIRYQVEAEAVPTSSFQSFKGLLLGLPLRAGFELRTHFTMALGLVLCLFLVGHGFEAEHRERLSQPEVTVYFGDDMGPNPYLVTTEFAGRTFFLNDSKVWVEEGLDASQTKAHIDARSPEGRALLHRFEIPGSLFADGSRVVLRHYTAMFELSSSHS